MPYGSRCCSCILTLVFRQSGFEMIRSVNWFLILSLLDECCVLWFCFIFWILFFEAWNYGSQHDFLSSMESLFKFGAGPLLDSLTFGTAEGLCSVGCGLHLFLCLMWYVPKQLKFAVLGKGLLFWLVWFSPEKCKFFGVGDRDWQQGKLSGRMAWLMDWISGNSSELF